MPYTDSDSAQITLQIHGIWLHEPSDPQGTVRDFPYGEANHEDSFDSMGVGTYYVGRSSPVFDYGDPSSSSVSATIDVLNGSDYLTILDSLREFAAAKKELYYRDNRGRSMYGTMSGFKVSDQRWGAQVSFTFTQAYRVVTTVTS